MEKHPADINKASKFFLSFSLHETEKPPKNSDSNFSFVVSLRTFSCNTCKMSGNISSTLINSVYKQGVFRNSAKTEVLGVLNKVLYREAPPGGQPFTLLYTIFDRKGTPSYTFCWQWYSFHVLSLEHCIPLNSCKCTVFKIWINHKTRPFTQLFSQPCNASVSPFWAFLPTETTVFPILSYTSTSEIPTLSYT